MSFTHSSNARGLVVFEVAENHPHWLRVKELAESENAPDLVRTEYTTEEIEQAQLLRVKYFSPAISMVWVG